MSSTTNPNTLGPSEIEPFLQDLTRRFEPENELDGILGPVVRLLLFHISLFRPEGLGGGDSIWRGVIGGLEALVSVKSIAVMITRLPEWLPANVTASNFERVTLMGPLCRLGVFGREWVSFYLLSLCTSRDDDEYCSHQLLSHISRILKNVVGLILNLQMLVFVEL